MLAIELYCRTPFGRIHQGNPDIIALADVLDRTPGSVGMKMVNFAALDQTLDRKGMANASALDRETWAEFFADPVAFLDRVDNIRQRDFSFPEAPEPAAYAVREGRDVEYTAKGRRNQDFFRRAVLAAYDSRCAVTGISQSDLLVASHIVGWAEDVERRVLPTNGLCLNALHDRAFDKHLISFDTDHTMILSKRLKITEESRPFFEGKVLTLPRRFRPDPDCLTHHRERMLEKDRAA